MKSDEPPKKHRGRPRKDKSQEVNKGKSQKDEILKRRGRPRKELACSKQTNVTSSRIPLRRSERLSMKDKDNKKIWSV